MAGAAVRPIITRALGVVGLALVRDVADVERRLHKLARREEAWIASECAVAEHAEQLRRRDADIRRRDERIAELLAHLKMHDRCPAWPDFRHVGKSD